MTAFVTVTATGPDGTTTHTSRWHNKTVADLLTLFRTEPTANPHDHWDGDTLTRVRCDHGYTRDGCRELIETYRFTDHDPRETA